MLYAEELSQDVKKRVRTSIVKYKVMSLFMVRENFRKKLEDELKVLHRGFEGICCLFETDQFAKINYERKNRSKEDIGPRLSQEEVIQYVAIRTLLERRGSTTIES